MHVPLLALPSVICPAAAFLHEFPQHPVLLPRQPPFPATTCLQDTSVQQLARGLHNLKLQLSEHTGQLKALVRPPLPQSSAPFDAHLPALDTV